MLGAYVTRKKKLTSPRGQFWHTLSMEAYKYNTQASNPSR